MGRGRVAPTSRSSPAALAVLMTERAFVARASWRDIQGELAVILSSHGPRIAEFANERGHDEENDELEHHRHNH